MSDKTRSREVDDLILYNAPALGTFTLMMRNYQIIVTFA